MEYHEAIDYLQSLQRRRPKLGTETTRRMLSFLGDPDAGIDCLQIAGSNGKGSTARVLENVLLRAGLDVGLFTSPCLNDLREQIRVDGREISRARLADYVERIDPCIRELRADDDLPTHFEVMTALAIHHFGAEEVDVAILEVGIGGRYDATSAVDPVASAVTSVSLEHTELLGETVEEIARDKAQVAPEGRPLVTGTDGAALEAIREVTEVVTVGPTGDVDVQAIERGMRSRIESDVTIGGPDWTVETSTPLLGQHQATNAGVAATLARQVADVDAETIAAGIRSVTWPGRFEIMDTEPMVVLDGSHNPGASATLADLLERYEYDDLHLVFGAMGDKDHEAIVDALPAVETAYLTRPAVDRAESPDVLAEVFADHAAGRRTIPSVSEATQRAIDAADESDFVLVTGSLYVVAEARDRWTRLVVPADRACPQHRSVLSGAEFPETTPADVDHRTVRTTLRTPQADQVERHFEEIGGTVVRSTGGTPEKFVATVLSGTVAEFRTLGARLDAAGNGLAAFAGQLMDVVDGEARPDGSSDGGTSAGGTSDGGTSDGGTSDSSSTAGGTSVPSSVDATARSDGGVLGSPAVMGVLNVTPDSFHDGGEHAGFEAALSRAEEMIDAGADVIDVGGESTRPGAAPVTVQEEIDRVVPVIEAISSLGVPVSVDTRKAAVADAALSAGATIVNDVSGLSDPEMRFVVADHDASLVLMHSLSAPVDPAERGGYDDVVDDVLADLSEQLLLAERAGVDREQIIVDPGCGFGKDAAESFELVDRLPEFRALGCRLMVGHSHKSMFDRVDCGPDERLPPTLAVTAMAAERGVDVIRVHDVEENAAVVRTAAATNESVATPRSLLPPSS